MSQPFRGRTLACSAALALLAACGDDTPVAAGATDAPGLPDPTLAVGFYGLSGAPSGPVGGPCTRSEYRQFDFWVGTWEVRDFNTGDPGGTSVITSGLDGCAVFESYEQSGYVGRSLNTYDAATGQWHQHWMSNDGLPVVLDGAFDGTSMILQGTRPSPAGPVTDRIAWTPLGPAEVRQVWDISTDGGVTFPTVQFDGRYLGRETLTREPEIPTTGCVGFTFPAYRLFDFTMGEWTVDVQGEHRSAPSLRSTIAFDVSQCLTEERLTGRAGYEARVFSTMRRRTGEWLRTYMDNRGIRVHLRGFPSEGSLVLTGTMPLAGGKVADVRAVWEPGASGFVQRYETSTDGGATWSPLREATYRPS